MCEIHDGGISFLRVLGAAIGPQPAVDEVRSMNSDLGDHFLRRTRENCRKKNKRRLYKIKYVILLCGKRILYITSYCPTHGKNI